MACVLFFDSIKIYLRWVMVKLSLGLVSVLKWSRYSKKILRMEIQGGVDSTFALKIAGDISEVVIHGV